MLVPEHFDGNRLASNDPVGQQLEMAPLVSREDRLPQSIQFICGVDVAYDTRSDRLFAAAVMLCAADLSVIETATVETRATFPYSPGVFSLRELPPLVEAVEKLNRQPDLIVCDGQGLAHPRRFGLACHLGVYLDRATIGCAKTRLIGEFGPLGPRRGDYSPLEDANEIIGSVLRTQDFVRPLFVSIGHRISLPTARDWILRLTPRFRLPETTRMANHVVNEYRRITCSGLDSPIR